MLTWLIVVSSLLGPSEGYTPPSPVILRVEAQDGRSTPETGPMCREMARQVQEYLGPQAKAVCVVEVSA